jgi:hypothetical protein
MVGAAGESIWLTATLLQTASARARSSSLELGHSHCLTIISVACLTLTGLRQHRLRLSDLLSWIGRGEQLSL